MSGSLPIRIHHNSPQHWAIRAAWIAATVLFVLYIPTKAEPQTIQDMNLALQLAIAAMALNLAMGFGGIISLGHSAFFGLGGYTTAVLVDHYGWGHGWTIYVAVVLGFVVGCATSLPALRLKGVYLALVSLGLAVLFPQLVKWRKVTWLTDGARGINDIAYDEIPKWPILGELERSEGRAVFMWWLTIIVVTLTYLVCRGVVKSRIGRSLIAIRDNDTAAAVMGVNRTATKTIVYGLSASMCAAGGSLFAISGNLASPELRMFSLVGGITFLLVMVLGGAATLWGPIVGAIAYVVIETRTRELAEDPSGALGWVYDRLFGWVTGSAAPLILAILLLGMMYIAPFGIIGLLKRLASRFLVIVPAAAGSGPLPAPVDEGPDPSLDEPFLPSTTGETT